MRPLLRVSVNTPLRPKHIAPRKDTLSDFQSSAFYRTIVDNNLFRPLGWTPARPIEPYRLIGTLLPKDANAVPQAILQATAGNKTYTVALGDTLGDDTTITDIQPKHVTLSIAGKPRTLHLTLAAWLR